MTMLTTTKQIIVCLVCRAEEPADATEDVTRLWERIDKYTTDYMKGENRRPKNRFKEEELLKCSYDLGNPAAVFLTSF